MPTKSAEATATPKRRKFKQSRRPPPRSLRRSKSLAWLKSTGQSVAGQRAPPEQDWLRAEKELKSA